MDNLQFVQQIYHGKNCYADSMTPEQIDLLHIPSGVESIVQKMINEKRIVFLTGNPGDGKTFIIKALKGLLDNVFVVTDMNSMPDWKLPQLAQRINDCYINGEPCVIAANEFPFHKLTNIMKQYHPKLYEELIGIKKNILVLGYPTVELKRVCIVDLNERNLLDKDRCVVKSFIQKFTDLLLPYCGSNHILAHNVKALKNDLALNQILDIFSFISMSGQHFVIRDILEAVSYMLVSCTDAERDDEESWYYYDALFSTSNDLMTFAVQFDPILLSKPELDEKLWNGEFLEGWQFDCPSQWPVQITKGNGSVEEATSLFKSIKRKFYFENIYAMGLTELQPQDFRECMEILVRMREDIRRIKRMLIYSMNRLFLSTDDESEKLRSWTTHSYDLSRQAGASVSTRYIDANDLELAYPEPAKWLSEMEYSPACIVMFSSKRRDIRLEINIDLLRSLIRIKNGYPASLLSTHYEQTVSQFVRALCSAGISRDYPDGEVLIANRREGTLKRLRIENDKYYLGNGVGF